MEKEFVPYEQALALKELGFDEPCFGYYDDNLELFLFKYFNYNSTKIVSAPMWQHTFRWFREKYNLNVTVITNYSKVNSKLIKSYRVGIIILKNKAIDSYFLRPKNDKLSFIEFITYEEAELECLKKLIKIVKNNK